MIRSYTGSVTGTFAGLDSANIQARKGDIAKALAKYPEILKRVPHSAGLNYNIGLSLVDKKPELATDSFEMALRDCSNYAPAAGMLAQCYRNSGEAEKLAMLEMIWKGPEEEGEASPPMPGDEGSGG